MTELMQYRTARTRTELRNGRHVQSVYASDIHYMSGGGFEQCDPTIKSAVNGWKLVRVQPDSVVTGPFQFDIELPERARVKRRNAANTAVRCACTGANWLGQQ